MNIVVFGANGGVGRRLVESALGRGYAVTAALRDPTKMEIAGARVVPCDVQEVASIDKALTGQDAVLCALGTPSRGPTTLYSEGARNIVRRMEAHGIRRIVFLSNFGVLGETAQGALQTMMLLLVRRVIRHTLTDHRRAIDEIRARAPEWIIVRPLALTDGPRTGQYRVARDQLPPKGTRIARADVADFMLGQVAHDDYVGAIPSLAY
jgi:putative NADH-flavin reductase